MADEGANIPVGVKLTLNPADVEKLKADINTALFEEEAQIQQSLEQWSMDVAQQMKINFLSAAPEGFGGTFSMSSGGGSDLQAVEGEHEERIRENSAALQELDEQYAAESETLAAQEETGQRLAVQQSALADAIDAAAVSAEALGAAEEGAAASLRAQAMAADAGIFFPPGGGDGAEGEEGAAAAGALFGGKGMGLIGRVAAIVGVYTAARATIKEIGAQNTANDLEQQIDQESDAKKQDSLRRKYYEMELKESGDYGNTLKGYFEHGTFGGNYQQRDEALKGLKQLDDQEQQAKDAAKDAAETKRLTEDRAKAEQNALMSLEEENRRLKEEADRSDKRKLAEDEYEDAVKALGERLTRANEEGREKWGGFSGMPPQLQAAAREVAGEIENRYRSEINAINTEDKARNDRLSLRSTEESHEFFTHRIAKEKEEEHAKQKETQHFIGEGLRWLQHLAQEGVKLIKTGMKDMTEAVKNREPGAILNNRD